MYIRASHAFCVYTNGVRIYTGSMGQHNIRIDQDLWGRAMAKARSEARTLTDVITEALTAYARPEPAAPRARKPSAERAETWDQPPAVSLRARPDLDPPPVPQAAFSDPPVNPLAPPEPGIRRCTHAGRRVNGGWCTECQWTIEPGGKFHRYQRGRP